MRLKVTLPSRPFILPYRQSRHFAIPAAHATLDVDGEPLYRYKPGGYHPIHLGDTLNRGRYTILHKLGWGGYATIWLAQDQMSVS